MPVLGVGSISLLDLNDAIVSGTPPANPTVGTLWIDESQKPNKLKKWNGTEWIDLGDLDPDFGETLTFISTTLGNMANDNLIDFSERKTIKEKINEIIGYNISDSARSLPTTSELDASGKGDFWSVRKGALNAGIPATDSQYVAVATKYNDLKSYLEGLVPQPTFTRNSVAYKSDGTQVAANQPRLEQGGVIIEEGTTNLISNPSFETDSNADGLADGWSAWTGGDGDVNRNKIVSRSAGIFHGSYSQRVEIIATGNTIDEVISLSPYASGITAGQTYTASAYVRSNVTNKVKIVLVFYDINNNLLGGYIYGESLDVANQIKRISVTATAPTGAAKANVMIRGINVAGEWMEVDAVQLEQKPYATSFVDGTRQPETLMLPTAGVLFPDEGTIEMELEVPYISNYNNFFRMEGLSNGRFLLFFNNNRRVIFDYGAYNQGVNSSDNAISPNTKTFIAMRWSGKDNSLALFVNGNKYTRALPSGVASAFQSTVSIVNSFSATIYNLRISKIARPDDDILKTYHEGFTIDNYTTAYFDFENNINNIGTVWDTSDQAKDKVILVNKEEFRNKWLDYYNAVNALAQATAQKLKDNVDDLDIGGRNLLTNSSQEFRTITLNQYGGYNQYELIWQKPLEELGLKNGDYITLSMYFDDVSEEKSVAMRFDFVREDNSYIISTGPRITKPGRYSFTTKIPDSQEFVKLSIRLMPKDSQSNYGYQIKYKEAKLEKGNKATDWTPAPEDVQDQIDDLGTRVTTAETSITQLSNQIQLKANQTTVDTITGQVNNLQAQLTIQAGQIATKVEKNGVISAINQTAESIKIQASKVDLSGYVTFTNLSTPGQTTIDGGNIKANSITVEKLIIGDFTNLCENPDFEGDAVGSSPKGYVQTSLARVADISGFANGNGSNRALEIDARNGGNTDVYASNIFPVRPGQQFFIEAEARYLNTTGSGYLRIGFRRYDDKKTALSAWHEVVKWDGTKVTSFTRKSGTFTVPSGTGYLQIWISFSNNGETTNKAYIDNIRVHRMAAGELIVDGSITTTKLAAKSITADKLNVTSLSAISADLGTVTAGTIRGVNIYGSTIEGTVLKSSDRPSWDDPNYKTKASIQSGWLQFWDKSLGGELKLDIYGQGIILKGATSDWGFSPPNYRPNSSTYTEIHNGSIHVINPNGDGKFFIFTDRFGIGGGLNAVNFEVITGSLSSEATVKIGDYTLKSEFLGEYLTLSGGKLKADVVGTLYAPSSNTYIANNGEARVVWGLGYNGGDFYYRPIRASSFPTASLAEHKEDIHPWQESALEKIRNATIYEYYLKSELEQGIYRKRQGLVVGEGYNTPDGVIDGDGVEQYLMNAWSWKAIQELDSEQMKMKDEIEWLKLENQYLKQKIQQLEGMIS